MVDEAGKKTASNYYSPRGVTEATENKGAEQPYRFAGTYQDPTAMYHMGARYYDPRIGRFTQPDPSGQEENPYLYAQGDPVNMIDPTGLAPTAGEITVVTLGVVSMGTGVGAALGVGALATTLGGISLSTGIAGGIGGVACMFSDDC